MGSNRPAQGVAGSSPGAVSKDGAEKLAPWRNLGRLVAHARGLLGNGAAAPLRGQGRVWRRRRRAGPGAARGGAATVVGGLWGRRHLAVHLRSWGTCHGPLRTLSICPQGPLFSDLCTVQWILDQTSHHSGLSWVTAWPTGTHRGPLSWAIRSSICNRIPYLKKKKKKAKSDQVCDNS